MSVENDKDADHRTASGLSSKGRNSHKPPAKKKGPTNNDVGGALRSVYQRTVDERIPPDLLDLLGKLG